MQIRQIAANAGRTVAGAFDPIRKWSTLERGLAVACATSPLFMVWFDAWTIRPTISHFYDMTHAVAFYVPLTIASMMFITNGVVKHRHAYNWMLGVALLGIVVLDRGAFPWPHRGFVALFFGGNILVMVLSKTRAMAKLAIVGIGALFLVVAILLDEWKLFWLEWASLWVIAIHYFLEARKAGSYQAPGEQRALAA